MSNKGKKDSVPPEVLTPRIFYVICIVIFLAFVLAHNLMPADTMLSVWSTEKYSHIFLQDFEEHDEKLITVVAITITIIGIILPIGSSWLHIDSLRQKPILPPPIKI